MNLPSLSNQPAAFAVERYTGADGTRWERVWISIAPGMSQLVWQIGPAVVASVTVPAVVPTHARAAG